MRFRNGGELLVEVLRAAGVDTVFGVISIHNLPLVEAVDAAMRFVPVRHEAAAVNAADGYSRARGGLGCALTSTGTGAGNAAGSLVEALTAGSSVLHITGQVPTEYLGQGRGFIHETKDQASMLAAVSAYSHTVNAGDDIGQLLSNAVTEALRAPGGPVSVEWPIDLQYAAADTGPIVIDVASAQGPLQATIEQAAELIARAKRPAIWAGGGVAECGDELKALLERTSAALFTSNAGRGAVGEDHDLCVGNYATTAAGQELLDEADVLLSIGSHFRSNETHSYKLRLPAVHIQIDLDSAALGRVYPATVGIQGDAGLSLRALLDALPADEPAVDTDWRARIGAVRNQVRSNQRRDIGSQAEICDAIAEALPRTGIVARDVTIPASSWGNRLLPMYDPRGNIFARGGGIGQGLAMGIGASVGRPDEPVVIMVGDGGLAVHFGELLTLAQEACRATLIVFNDGGYGVLRNMQDSLNHKRSGVDLHTPDFEALAAALGLKYARIDDSAQAKSVIADSVASEGPTLVEVDLIALGPMPKPFVPPVEVPQEPQG